MAMDVTLLTSRFWYPLTKLLKELLVDTSSR